MTVVDKIIFGFPGDTNCPIGNVTSQWFVNWLLTKLDLFIMHTLHHRSVRFCDNSNTYCDTLAEAHYVQEQVEWFMHHVLHLELSKSNIRRTADGIDFVGYRHFSNGKLLVRKRTVKKQRKNLCNLPEMLQLGLITKDQMRSTIDSYLGWWKHAQTHNLIESTGILQMREKYCA